MSSNKKAFQYTGCVPLDLSAYPRPPPPTEHIHPLWIYPPPGHTHPLDIPTPWTYPPLGHTHPLDIPTRQLHPHPHPWIHWLPGKDMGPEIPTTPGRDLVPEIPAPPHPTRVQIDRHLWKHYLLATIVAGGNKLPLHYSSSLFVSCCIGLCAFGTYPLAGSLVMGE